MSNLSQQEKNDIIAERIMGWYELRGFWYSKTESVVDGFKPVSRYEVVDEKIIGGFNPCNSLDDCFLAEEKILEKGPAQFVASYLDNLAELVSKHGKYTSYALGREFRSIHATPKQKVNAMLKALNITSRHEARRR